MRQAQRHEYLSLIKLSANDDQPWYATSMFLPERIESML
jgi:hypothetical protein